MNSKTKLTLNTILTLASLIALSSVASAQATRTWVSGVGDDANPCSRTAPCKTFAGAISKTAPGGEIDVLDPGGFGALTITKSISIEADGLIAGVLVSGTNGFVVNAPGANVMIRGITFEGLGTGLAGISVVAANEVHIEQCWINNFTGTGVDFGPNSAASLEVEDTVITNCAGGGVRVHPSSGVTIGTINNVRCKNNLYGFRVDDNGKVTINNSVAANNTNNGFLAASASAATILNVNNSVASSNGVQPASLTGSAGVVTSGANATIRISNVMIAGNLNGISTPTGTVASWGTNYNADNGAPNSTLTKQ
jgi:hypothetical protein